MMSVEIKGRYLEAALQRLSWRDRQPLGDMQCADFAAPAQDSYARLYGDALDDPIGGGQLGSCAFDYSLRRKRWAGCQLFVRKPDAPEHTTVAFTHRLVLEDGTVRWLPSQGELVRDHRDALPRFIVVSLDITASKEREEKLAKTLEDRDRLVAQTEALLGEVNHRIKNSLQIVSSILNTDAHRAVKHGPVEVPDGVIKVSTRLDAGNLVLQVADNGTGKGSATPSRATGGGGRPGKRRTPGRGVK